MGEFVHIFSRACFVSENNLESLTFPLGSLVMTYFVLHECSKMWLPWKQGRVYTYQSD